MFFSRTRLKPFLIYLSSGRIFYDTKILVKPNRMYSFGREEILYAHMILASRLRSIDRETEQNSINRKLLKELKLQILVGFNLSLLLGLPVQLLPVSCHNCAFCHLCEVYNRISVSWNKFRTEEQIFVSLQYKEGQCIVQVHYGNNCQCLFRNKLSFYVGIV